MATIDDLINQIPDEGLRSRLAEQVKVLTDRKEFGLVFQDHTPEAIEVPGLPPRKNDVVRLRGDFGKVNYSVQRCSKGQLTIVPIDATGVTSGDPLETTVDKVNVVKDFGEPIYAGLRSLERIEGGGDKPSHIVIQGENYYALETLMYTHEGKIDVIYIDPPYNTGSAGWIYNDRYVDGQDAYRHSKWLAFMKRRLEHARRLLKPSGVMIMAIDDNEHARLKLLADQEFGEQNFIANVVWQGGRKNDSRYVSVGHDYMLIYARSIDALREDGVRWREKKFGVDEVLAAGADAWERASGDSVKATALLRDWFRAQPKGLLTPAVTRFKSIEPATGYVYNADKDLNWPGGGGPKYEILHPVTGKPVAIPSSGWRYTPTRMAEEIVANRIEFGNDERKIPRGKTYLYQLDSQVAESVFSKERTGASVRLKDILGSKEFPFPKDVEVLARWINLTSSNNPSAVVLDFFAGTGTTAEAVMRLNAEDGGHRQSIIVTNNELAASTAKRLSKAGHLPGDAAWEAEGIFQKVTRPRVETIVTGIRSDGSTFSGGLEENVEFLQLTYEDPDRVELGLGFDAIAPLLWLKAGATGDVIERTPVEGWAINSDGSYGVLFDVKYASVFTKAARASAATIRHAFIITNQESAFQQVVTELPPQSRAFGSTRLYSDYVRTFQINGKD